MTLFFRVPSLLVAFEALLLLAVKSHAQIYSLDGLHGSVSGYNLNGSTINTALIKSGADSAIAISGSFIYTSNARLGFISKYTTGGSVINSNLITVNNTGMAVSEDTIYVNKGNSIALYSTTGTLLNDSFITGLNRAGQISLYKDSLYVMWSNNTSESFIDQYDATTGALIHSSLVSNLYASTQFAIADDFIYTTNYAFGYVSKYFIDGALANPVLVGDLGNAGADGLAVFEGNLYVGNINAGVIGKYDANTGAPIAPSFITNQNFPTYLLVVPEPSSSALLVTSTVFFSLWVSRRRRISNAV